MSTVAKPLAGIKVLDISRVLAGPWCGQMLADMGAEVIKIERPQSGDDTRHWGPPWLSGSAESAYYLCANRGKRSVTVEMVAQGQALIKQLTAQSDVLLENFKVGGLKKWPGLREPESAQSRLGLLLHHRLWPGEPLRPPGGLRLRSKPWAAS